MDVWVGLWRRLSAKELMLLNCGVGEDSWESLGLQGDPTSSFWRRSALGVLWRNDAKAETPVRWPPHAKGWLIGKDSDAGREWGQKEKRMTEDVMVGWHHWLNGCESELTLGVGDVHGGPACCDSWGRKKLDMIEQLNWNEYIWVSFNDLHETGAYYTEWSKPERKTPIQYTNSYVELRKMVSITLYVRQQKRHRCTEQSFGLCGERPTEGTQAFYVGGMIWENHTETCILPYVKKTTSPGLMHETRCSELVHWDDPEGWDEEGVGRGAQDVEHMCTHGWLMLMYGKIHYNIVK